MSYDISDVNVLFPAKIDWQEFEKYQPWEPFADEVLEFLSVMSASLLKDRESRLYPGDVRFLLPQGQFEEAEGAIHR